MSEDWSQWLDFDRQNIEAVPESPGVFVMHASMKVLYIGASANIRQGLIERLSNECSSKAKRFRYMLAQSPEDVKASLLQDYSEKHQGKMPLCNDN
jgi:excinuclease UvrABC nuclease subunit